jgi:hypothetical protein
MKRGKRYCSGREVRQWLTASKGREVPDGDETGRKNIM